MSTKENPEVRDIIDRVNEAIRRGEPVSEVKEQVLSERPQDAAIERELEQARRTGGIRVTPVKRTSPTTTVPVDQPVQLELPVDTPRDIVTQRLLQVQTPDFVAQAREQRARELQGGFVSPRPERTNWLRDEVYRVDTRINILESQARRGEGLATVSGARATVEAAGLGTYRLGLGFLEGFELVGKSTFDFFTSTPAEQRETLRAPFRAIADPRGTAITVDTAATRIGTGIGSGLRDRPISTASEIATGIIAPTFIIRGGREAQRLGTLADPRFRPVRDLPGGVQVIEGVPRSTPLTTTTRPAPVTVIDPSGTLRVQIAPAGDGIRYIPITQREMLRQFEGITPMSPAVRGGFGYTFTEQAAFAGQTVDVATAQRGLFSPFQRRIVVDKPGDIPLERTLFVSPPDPVTGDPVLRASRLFPREGTLADVLAGSTGIGVPGRPQALVFQGVRVADIPSDLQPLFRRALAGDRVAEAEFFRRFQTRQLTPTGEFQPLGFRSTEAEFTLAPGSVVERGRVLGVTLIEDATGFHRRVPLIEARIGQASPEVAEAVSRLQRGAATPDDISLVATRTGFSEREIMSSLQGDVFDVRRVSTLPSGVVRQVPGLISPDVSGESVVSRLDVTGFSGVSVVSPPTRPDVWLSPSRVPVVDTVSPISPTPSRRSITSGGPSSPSPVIPISPISPTPDSPSPLIPGRPTPLIPGSGMPILPGSPPSFIPRFPGPSLSLERSRPRESLFQVMVRREGRFRPVGFGMDLSRAVKVGVREVGGTAAASFKVLDERGEVVDVMGLLPRGKATRFRPAKREPGVVVERRRFRISSPGELREITFKGLEELRMRSGGRSVSNLKGKSLSLANGLLGRGVSLRSIRNALKPSKDFGRGLL